MIQSENKGTGIGAFVGFLAGVGVGLLFAPKPGNETRRQVGNLLIKGRRKGEELLGRDQTETAKEKMVSEGGKEPFYESGKYT